MMTSCCHAWVKYCETYGHEELAHLSTAKSLQQMFGAVIKTFFAKKEGVDPEKSAAYPSCLVRLKSLSANVRR